MHSFTPSSWGCTRFLLLAERARLREIVFASLPLFNFTTRILLQPLDLRRPSALHLPNRQWRWRDQHRTPLAVRLLDSYSPTGRPVGGASGPSQSESTLSALPNASPSTQQKRRRMMMHDELAALLPPEVYLALESAAGMAPERRAKFHKACKDATVTAVLDNTTSAAFGHRTLLALPEGQHFDSFKRGRALACAGRSAPVGSAAFNEQVTPSAPCRFSGPPSFRPSAETTRSPVPRSATFGPPSPP
jgi:hypothetical protein